LKNCTRKHSAEQSFDFPSLLGRKMHWGIVGAHNVGAPHKRDRIWILADAERTEWRPELQACDGLARQVGISQREEGTSWTGACSEDVADSNSERKLQQEGGKQKERRRPSYGGSSVADTNRQRQQERRSAESVRHEFTGVKCPCSWWGKDPGQPKSELGGMANGVASWLDESFSDVEGGMERVAVGIHKRVDRLRAIGNGQVPAAAAEAFRVLMEDAA
jgi:DNA (cytosine-5)-methyltransferase 1